jgi:hypothetical protein
MRSLSVRACLRGIRLAAAGSLAASAALLAVAPAGPAWAAAARAAAAGTPASSAAAAAPAYQTPQQALAQAKKTGQPVPVTGATTPTATLTANPDGTWTETESGAPVRAKVGGAWRDLDATLAQNADGTYSPTVSTDPLTLSDGGTGPLAVMTAGGVSLALTAPMTLPAPVVSGNTATYESVLPGVNLIVTAGTSGGFSEVFEVENATAAASPALQSLSFGITAKGLALKTAADGTISALGANGQPVFAAPAPGMWDSTIAAGLKTAVNPAGTVVDVAAARPAASTPRGPGTGARTAKLGVAVSGSTLTLTPGAALLGAADATYPEFIDPTWDAAGESASSWAYVSAAYPSQEYFDTSSALQVGVDPDDGTTSDAFYTMPLPSQVKGATIHSATAYFPEIWSYSCTASPVDLYLTGAISKSTTYNNQPAWGTKLGSDNVAYGWSSTGETGGSSSCPYGAKDVSYDITSTIASDAAGTLPASLTFGLKAEDTSDSTGWKQFTDPGFSAIPADATITIQYADAPATPTLSTSPASNCKTGTTVLGDGDVYLDAKVSDKDGGTLSAAYTAYADGSSADTFATNKSMTVSEGSGGTAQLELKAADLEAAAAKYGSGGEVTVSWSASVSTGLSGVATASASCGFVFNDAAPGAPSVTDSAGNPGCSTQSYTAGTPASFTAQAADGTVSSTAPVSYVYQLNGGNTVTAAAGASSPYSASLSVTPTRLTNVLDVTAVGAGGNLGQTFSCVINAAPPATAADQDMTGDGAPDLVTVGAGTSGTASGLWLAAGQENGGRFDGTVNTTAADVAPLGPQDNAAPAAWNGLQAITGQFTDSGFNDIEAYQPGTPDVYILSGQGDGSAATSQEESLSDVFTDASSTSGNTNDPLQLVDAYNVSGDDEPYPDQIGVFNDTDTAVGSYLAYFANSDSIQSFDASNGDVLPYELTNPSPDGTMDWNDWTITTDSDTRGGTAYTDMWLRNESTGALYLWELTGLADENPGGFDLVTFTNVNPTATLDYTQTQVSSSWDKGTGLSTFQATDVGGTSGIVTVTSAGQVQSWAWNGTALTQANASGSAQQLLTADHTWLLDDAASGTVTAAADQPGAGDTADNLAGTGSVTWNSGDQLFSPDAKFSGTSGYLNGTAAAVATNASFTISAWVDPSALGGTVFSQNGALYAGIAVSSTASGQWQVEMDGTNTNAASYTSADGGTARAGVWTNLTLTYNTAGGADLLKLYVNGTESISLADTAPPNATGRFSLGAVQVNGAATGFFAGQIADVQTWNGLTVPAQAATPGSQYVPDGPVRILDTRSSSHVGPVTGPIAANATVTMPVEGITTNGANIPAAGVTAVDVAFTALSPTANGNVIAYPDGTSRPVTAALPFSTSTSATEDAIVPVGADGKIAIQNDSPGTVQLAIDLTGYFTTSTGKSTYEPLATPVRVLDTRNGTGTSEAETAAGGTVALTIAGTAGIPSGSVTAVAINITAIVPATGDSGNVTAYADGTSPAPTGAPELSYDGNSQSATILVPVGTDGKIDIYNGSSTAVNLAGDVSGYFTTSQNGQLYHSIDSTRLLDTRQTSAVAANGAVTVAVPASITADNPTLILSITALAPTASGYLKAQPSSTPSSGTATVNFTSGQTAGNLALVNTATGNAFTIGNASSAAEQVIADTNGYFS